MVRRVVEVFGKFWQSGGFDHPSDPDLITCCRPLTSRVRIPHAVLIAANLMVKSRSFQPVMEVRILRGDPVPMV